MQKLVFGHFGAKLGDLGSFGGKIGEFGGKIGSNDTHYGIPCADTRRLRYYMQNVVWGHFGAKLGDFGEFWGSSPVFPYSALIWREVE